MNSKYKVLALSVLAGCFFSLAQAADNDPDPALLGHEKTVIPLKQVHVENLQGEHLGRFSDIAIDLDNGRIVEVLVRRGGFMGLGGDIVAVPPGALKTDNATGIYRINMSKAVFKAAPAVKTSMWNDADRSTRVAAAYRYFGLEPYFSEKTEKPDSSGKRSERPMGYIERSTKIVGMTVVNKNEVVLGKVDSLSFDVSTGKVSNVVILAPGNLNERSVVPSMALRYNPARLGLVLDDTPAEFAAEPRIVQTVAANGQPATTVEESYEGPVTAGALEQGKTENDRKRTADIKRAINTAKISAKHVEVGTINGRVTLRGWAETSADRDSIEAIAITEATVELVDNQITVGKPAAK
jgi:sporulation protein YlmC with PRC-barrel domain